MTEQSGNYKKKKLGLGMPAGVGLLLSLLVFAICLWLTWGIMAEAGWPTASGVVNRSFIGTRKDPLSRQGKMLYCLNVSYKYEVKGREYSNISELDFSRSESDILAKSHDFDLGSSIPVRYNPKNPQETFLNHRMAEAPLPVLVTLSGFSLLFALSSLFALFASWLRKP